MAYSYFCKAKIKMINQLRKNVWQFTFKEFGSHAYLIKLKANKEKRRDKNHNILIDTSSAANKEQIIKYLKKLDLNPEDITKVFFTHCHWDHTGGLGIYKNAKFYGNRKDFGRNLINPKKSKIKEFKIINTPGHSKGGICILYKDILFTGDTLFHRGTIGTTAIPGGCKKDMEKSLKKLAKIKCKILAPGHGRE